MVSEQGMKSQMKSSTHSRVAAAPWSVLGAHVPLFAFQWMFSYVGFPVALSTRYFIGAHNIPNANMNEDSPSLSVNFTSPGKPRSLFGYSLSY